MSDLARRAVSAEGWRITDGMRLVPAPGSLDRDILRVLHVDWSLPSPATMVVRVDRTFYARKSRCIWVDYLNCYYFPDLTDPATLGCILALVREKHGPDCFVRCWPDVHWMVYRPDSPWSASVIGKGKTEAEALVAALEASKEGR